jgi:polyhydroxyalkanoate synthase
MEHAAMGETAKVTPIGGKVALQERRQRRKRTGECEAPQICDGPQTCKGAPETPWERDSYASTAIVEILDRSLHAAAARTTASLSPASLAGAYFDWLMHLMFSPGKQVQLVEKARRKWFRYFNYAARCALRRGDSEVCIEPLPQDKRFADPAWSKFPYNLMSQGFLLQQQFWHNATTGVRGVTPQHERAVEFASRQVLDIFSPSNFILTNPEILNATIAEGGANLVRGWQNLAEDVERAMSAGPPVGAENYLPGEAVAVTPGKVVYRNRLMELIQYEPATEKVRAEPVLIVPAWIMKYYILDLSPENSLVRYLTGQGFTVFMISWKNPGPEDRDTGLDDYRKLGVEEALKAVSLIVPARKVHGVGYCLGGTLLAIAAAAKAQNGDDCFASLTFLAAQVDFQDPGELSLFINESQVAFLEDVMWEQGFLETKQMAGAFQMLRSNDLVWSRMQHDYFLGKRRPINDLMAWNADQTRMPFRMHSEYLRHLFLDNDLAEGRYEVDGRAIAISDIRTPIFAVGTVKDHVAPWRSVYKLNLLSDTEVTFVLTSGGHNAGIVSEPGHPRRQFQIRTAAADAAYIDPELWLRSAEKRDGSWWPAWTDWLKERSGEETAPPDMAQIEKRADRFVKGGEPSLEAPGEYVFMK